MAPPKVRDLLKKLLKESNARCKEAGEDPVPLDQMKKVDLKCSLPSIVKIGNKEFEALTSCEHLALSTNQITNVPNISALVNLKILSLGRNNIKTLKGVEALAGSLEELWISYNPIEKITSLDDFTQLKVLYMGNNQIKSFDEVDNVPDCVTDLMLWGNPMYENEDNPRYQIHSRKPAVFKIDGTKVTEEDKVAPEVPEE